MNPTDPLAQLRDIHLPDAVSWWPPAPGWWLAGLVLLLAFLVLSWWLYSRWRGAAYRRAAIAELQGCFEQLQQSGKGLEYLQQLNAILKRAALISFPRDSVAALSGKAWCEFLEQTGDGRNPGVLGASALATSPYSGASEPGDTAALHHAALDWLSRHKARHD